MVGDWEVIIKSVKRTLKTFTCDLLFTEDAFHTFICKQSLITTSRDHINNYESLTLNHILFKYSPSNYTPSLFQDGEINYQKK